MRAQNQAHHTIDRLEERSLKEEELDDLSLKGPGGKGGGEGGYRQTEEYCNRFKGNVGDTSERRDGAHMGFSERIDTTLNSIDLN